MSERDQDRQGATKDLELTRRRAVGLAAGAAVTLVAGERWAFAAREGEVVKVSTAPGAAVAAWRPVLLTDREGEALARLVETILPRTSTPGARDARVHEYIDLAVSLDEPEAKKSFVDGLRWLDRRAKKLHGKDLVDVADADLVALLHSISDEQKSLPKSLAPGGEFFANLKKRTIFGYYTSLEGRVQELGLPDTVSMQTWRGCQHPEGEHQT